MPRVTRYNAKRQDALMKGFLGNVAGPDAKEQDKKTAGKEKYVCKTCAPKPCWCGGAHLNAMAAMFGTYRRLREVVERRLRDDGADVTSAVAVDEEVELKARAVVEGFLKELLSYARGFHPPLAQLGADKGKRAPGSEAASLDAALGLTRLPATHKKRDGGNMSKMVGKTTNKFATTVPPWASRKK